MAESARSGGIQSIRTAHCSLSMAGVFQAGVVFFLVLGFTNTKSSTEVTAKQFKTKYFGFWFRGEIYRLGGGGGGAASIQQGMVCHRRRSIWVWPGIGENVCGPDTAGDVQPQSLHLCNEVVAHRGSLEDVAVVPLLTGFFKEAK